MDAYIRAIVKQKEEEARIKESYATSNCIVITICLLFIFSIPIIEIVFGIIYNNSSCDSLITPSLWLFVSASTYIIYTILVPLSKYVDKDLSNAISTILLSFNFIWMSIGSIVFWRDCKDKLPTHFDKFMWSMLLINWVIFAHVGYNRTKPAKKERELTDDEHFVKQILQIL